MSSPKKKKRLDRQKVKAFIQQHYGTYSAFCDAVDVNLGSFANWMKGVETMPAIAQKVRDAMHAQDYPLSFAENPDIEANLHSAYTKALAGEDVDLMIEPGVKLSITGRNI